jgi:hypothetical protein
MPIGSDPRFSEVVHDPEEMRAESDSMPTLQMFA